MKKTLSLLTMFILCCIVYSNDVDAFVTPNDRPEDDISAFFDVLEIADYELGNEQKNYYISVFDLKGNFLGGNYSESLSSFNRSGKPNVILQTGVDYVAKVEGEGILTRYQVFQVRDIITKSTYALADQLIVFSARGQLHRSLFTAVFGKGNSDFNHDINLSKDGRLVGNVKQAEMYNFNVMHGDYTIDFGQSYMYNIQVKPAQSLEFFPHVPKFTTQLHFEAVAFDETYKITDAEGYNVDTISRNKAYTGNLKSGAYEININGQQQSIVIDDMDSKRIWKMQNRDGGNAETGVSFTVLKAVKSDGLHVPVQLTVTAEDGTVIEKYREYTGATIKLPKPGRYTVSYENEGYYPQ